VAYVDETGAPTDNADGGNPDRRRGWQWVMVTAVVTVFVQDLSRSGAAAIELLGNAFGGIVVSDRFSAYNHLATQQRQLCWAHVIRDLTAIAERPGVSGETGLELLALQQQLFVQWHQWKDGTIDWDQLQQSCRPIRQHFEGTLQRVVDLGCARKERTPWAQTVRTCHKLLQRKEALWTFLEIHGVEPAGVPRSGVNPPAPPPRRSRGGSRSLGGWPSGWRCKGWAGPFPWFEYHLNQTNHAQNPLCRS